MELFIRKLIYGDMTKRNYSKVLKQIRRLHWEETEVRPLTPILHYKRLRQLAVLS